jgi:hypothetical protein
MQTKVVFGTAPLYALLLYSRFVQPNNYNSKNSTKKGGVLDQLHVFSGAPSRGTSEIKFSHCHSICLRQLVLFLFPFFLASPAPPLRSAARPTPPHLARHRSQPLRLRPRSPLLSSSLALASMLRSRNNLSMVAGGDLYWIDLCVMQVLPAAIRAAGRHRRGRGGHTAGEAAPPATSQLDVRRPARSRRPLPCRTATPHAGCMPCPPPYESRDAPAMGTEAMPQGSPRRRPLPHPARGGLPGPFGLSPAAVEKKEWKERDLHVGPL